MKSHRMDDGRWYHRIRQSWLNAFDLCPERARLEHEGYRRETDAASVGTAVHTTIQLCLEEYYASGEPFDEGTCVDIFNLELGSLQYERVKWKTDKPAFAHGQRCVREWHRQVLPTLPPRARLEVGFRQALYEDDERLIDLSGTIDYWPVYEHDLLRDWKTSGRGPYEEWEYRRWAIQPTVYAWAVDSDPEGQPREEYEFEYVVLGKHGVQRFSVTRTQEHFTWLQEKVLAACVLIEAQLDPWPMQDNHALCSPQWCDGWTACKGKFFTEEAWRGKGQ